MPSKAFVSAGAVVLLATLPAFAAAQNAEKRVFVSVSDKTGAPIEGLTAEHFAVRESASKYKAAGSP